MKRLGNRLRRCRTNLEVQQTFFYPLLHGIVDRCSDGLVLENSQSVDKHVPHTFITNHRDIVMDSAFLSISLLDNGFRQHNGNCHRRQPVDTPLD